MTPSLERLAETLRRLPGVGPKSASRMAWHILTLPKSYCGDLARALVDVADRVRNCPVCRCYTEREPCDICSDGTRDRALLCVVEHPKSIRVVESTGFRGLYHVTGGLISPLEGIGPEELRLGELLERIRGGAFREVIFAFSPRLEAETTIDFLRARIEASNLPVRLSRPASGLPVGADLEYADALTMHQAFRNRRSLE